MYKGFFDPSFLSLLLGTQKLIKRTLSIFNNLKGVNLQKMCYFVVMGHKTLRFSKSRIDKAGEVLKSKSLKKKDREECLEVLSNWRAYHTIPLGSFSKVLKRRVSSIDEQAIVAQRLKRTPSILLKLQKHKTMRLSTMQDIGGLRAIFDDSEAVYQLVDLYQGSKTKHKLFSLADYIETPKEDGYRGIHLVYKKVKNPSVFIEIQVRSSIQHIWATAVEVFGTLKNSSFKSGFGEKKWLEFFEYLSSAFAIKEGSNILEKHKKLSQKQIFQKLKKCNRDLQAIEQLNLYTKIYKFISKANKDKGRKGDYSLLVLDSNNNSIRIERYGARHIDKATERYLELEKKFYEDTRVNIVLVNTGDLKKLEASYPNYFMDTEKLTLYLSKIMLDKFL